MSDDRGPGVGPLTWVTLGLLAFSWLLLGGLSGWQLVREPLPWGEAVLILFIWAFASGPHLLLALAVWHGGHRFAVEVPAFVFAVLFAGQSVAVVGGYVGVIGPGPAVFACAVWLVGWPLSLLTLQQALRAPTSHDPGDDE